MGATRSDPAEGLPADRQRLQRDALGHPGCVPDQVRRQRRARLLDVPGRDGAGEQLPERGRRRRRRRRRPRLRHRRDPRPGLPDRRRLPGRSSAVAAPTTRSSRSSIRRCPGAASLVYSTYLGGTGQDLGYDIAYAGSRQVVIVGEADPGFPVVNAFDATHNGGNSDVFVAKFDTSLTGAASLLYSTFIGGSDYEFPWDVAVDPLGAVHVVGETRSTNFPAVNPIRTNFFQVEPFVFKMNAAGTALVYSTLFGIESNYKQVQGRGDQRGGRHLHRRRHQRHQQPDGADALPARERLPVDLRRRRRRRHHRAHRQRRGPAAHQDGRARAGRDGRHAHLHAHGHQHLHRPGDLGDADRPPSGRRDVRVVHGDRRRRLRRSRATPARSRIPRSPRVRRPRSPSRRP